MGEPTSLKDRIRDELLKCARASPVEHITYKELGNRLGVHHMAVSNKATLDQIAKEEMAKGLPDITFLLKNSKTGYPGQIDFKPAQVPDSLQMRKSRDEMQKIIDKYSPKSANPYP